MVNHSILRSNIFIIHTTLDNHSKQYILPIAEPIKIKCQRLHLPALGKTLSEPSNGNDNGIIDTNTSKDPLFNHTLHNDELCLHSVSKSDILDTLTAFGYYYNHATLHIDVSTAIKPASAIHCNTGLWLRVPDTELTLPVTQLYHPALGHGYNVTVAMELAPVQPSQNSTPQPTNPAPQSQPAVQPHHSTSAQQHNHTHQSQRQVSQSNTVSSTIKNSTIKSPVINVINSNHSPDLSPSADRLNDSGSTSSALNNSSGNTPQPSNGKRRKLRKKLKPAKSIGEMLDRMAQFEQARQQLKSKNKACRSLGYSKGTITSYARRIQAAFNRGIDLQQLRQTKYRQLKKVLDQYAGSADVQADIKWESDADSDGSMEDGDTEEDDIADGMEDASPIGDSGKGELPADGHHHAVTTSTVPNYSTDKESAVNMLADTASLIDNQTDTAHKSYNGKKHKVDKIDSLHKSLSDPTTATANSHDTSMPPPSLTHLATRQPYPHMLPPQMEPIQSQMALQPQPFSTAQIYNSLTAPNRYYPHFAGIQQYNQQLFQHVPIPHSTTPNMLTQMQSNGILPAQHASAPTVNNQAYRANYAQ